MYIFPTLYFFLTISHSTWIHTSVTFTFFIIFFIHNFYYYQGIDQFSSHFYQSDIPPQPKYLETFANISRLNYIHVGIFTIHYFFLHTFCISSNVVTLRISFDFVQMSSSLSHITSFFCFIKPTEIQSKGKKNLQRKLQIFVRLYVSLDKNLFVSKSNKCLLCVHNGAKRRMFFFVEVYMKCTWHNQFKSKWEFGRIFTSKCLLRDWMDSERQFEIKHRFNWSLWIKIWVVQHTMLLFMMHGCNA